MEENPYEAPIGELVVEEKKTRLGVEPARMLRDYLFARRMGVAMGAIGLAFAVVFLPPCGCGFAIMPGWKVAFILSSWAVIVLVVSLCAVRAVWLGMILWTRHSIPCPGMILAFAAMLLVLALSLPLFG